jgi:hypothetical protein
MITTVGLKISCTACDFEFRVTLLEPVEPSLRVLDILGDRRLKACAYILFARGTRDQVVNSAAHSRLTCLHFSRGAGAYWAHNNVVKELAAIAAKISVARNRVQTLFAFTLTPRPASTHSHPTREQKFVFGVEPFKTRSRRQGS